MTNKKYGTLYIGITNDLIKRVYQHKNHLIEGFTKKYDLTRLVYFESTKDIYSAIAQEKKMKKWNRDWKLLLIEQANSNWDDLYSKLISNGFPLSRE